MRTQFVRAALLIFISILTGCSTVDLSNEPVVDPEPQLAIKKVIMDTTKGSYGGGRESRLILVTMQAAAHHRLSNGVYDSTTLSPGGELPAPYQEFLHTLQQTLGIVRVADWPLPVVGIYCLVFEIEGDQLRSDIVVALELLEEVETAQPMQLFETLQSTEYNDPYLPLQHGFAAMQVKYSHQWASGNGVTVAVIDTGLDVNHPDLKDQLAQVRNFVDNNEMQFSADIHGTAVAGVIAANQNNAAGMVGIAPNATLMAIKACWQDAGSQRATCNSFTLARALNFAIAQSADIINLSLAGPRDRLLERLVATALQRNIVVVGAVSSIGVKEFPTVVKGTIAVALPQTENQDIIGAPGSQVLSTHPKNDYQFFTGSSFSTAHIAGLAALIKEIDNSIKPTAIQSLLQATRHAATGVANACYAVAYVANMPAGSCVQ